MAEKAFLELVGITKIFPGVKALDGVNFNLRRGEVHAICGENGAGKSTLINVLGGVHQPDGGKIIFDGKEVSFDNTQDAKELGIGIVHQELSLVSNLSVAENVYANRQPVNKLGMINKKQLNADTEKILRLFFSEGDKTVTPNTMVEDLSVANQQVVEIMKSMALNLNILVLDEPTSSLTNLEREKLFENIHKMKEMGIGIIYISHHLSEIFEICDRVTILRDGKYVATEDVKDVTEDKLVAYMVGREITNIYGEREPDALIGEPYFEVKDLYSRYRFKDISFQLRRGEILGISGLVGAGRTEVGMSIFGALPLHKGEVFLEGEKLDIKQPQDAIKHKIAYLTEDRKVQGLFLEMDIRSNIIAPDTFTYSKNALHFMDFAMVDRNSEAAVKQLKVATPSIQQLVGHLSGGNQQKVLLSMWLGINPKVLIVDEPTRGVDVGAKSDIYKVLRDLAKTGVGIIVISSDLMEVLGISDRIIVMRAGKMVGEFSKEEASEEVVIAAASGVKH